MGPILARILSIFQIIFGALLGVFALGMLMVFLDDLPHGFSEWFMDAVMLLGLSAGTIALFTGAIKRLMDLGSDSSTQTGAIPDVPIPTSSADPAPGSPEASYPVVSSIPSPHEGERVVSVESVIPIPGRSSRSAPPATAMAAPAGTPEERPAAPSEPLPKKQGENMASTNSRTEALDAFVLRSNNVLASLRDLVNHEASAAAGKADMHAAALLLSGTGIAGWTDLPRVSAMRLRRTDQFWLSLDEPVDDDAAWRLFVATETALNLAHLLAEDGIDSAAPIGTVKSMAIERLFRFFEEPHDRWDATPDIHCAYSEETAPQDTPGEWVSRMAVSWFCEFAPSPQRISFDMSGDVREGCMAINLYVPDPAILSFLADGMELARICRSWAFRMALAIGEEALVSHPAITRVVVNARPYRDLYTCLFSLELDGASLARMKAFASAYAPGTGAVPSDPALRVQLAQDGWFLHVEPFLTIADPCVDRDDRWTEVEIIDRESDQWLRNATGARRISDLGINENAGRIAAWRAFCKDYPGTTEEAVSKLMGIRDSAGEDLSVAEAASRTSEALVKGDTDISDRDGLRSIFVNGSALDVAVAEADRILDDDDVDEDGFAKAVALLEEALAPADQMGVYLDDTEEVFRYFGSASERLRFDLDIDDHSRRVAYVPDAYFRAHQLCSRVLTILERYPEAHAHNEVLLRIAPASIDAILANVRTLERESRIFETVDELIRGIKLSLSPRDAALCLYRLAYMEWKLGDSDLSAACYTRALRWNTDISDQARRELDDMIRDEELMRPTLEEADKALEAAGIPLGMEDAEIRILLASGVQCVDNGLFSIARAYLGTLYEATRNDTLFNVHRSLALKDRS